MKSQYIPEIYGQGCEKHVLDQITTSNINIQNKECGPHARIDRHTYNTTENFWYSCVLWELRSHRVGQGRKLRSSICGTSPLKAKKCEKQIPTSHHTQKLIPDGLKS